MERVTILSPVTFTDRKSKAGNAYRAADVQGLLHGADGSQQVFAILLMAPKGEQGTDLKPGMYEPVTSLRVSFSDRRLTNEIVGFKPAQAAQLQKAA